MLDNRPCVQHSTHRPAWSASGRRTRASRPHRRRRRCPRARPWRRQTTAGEAHQDGAGAELAGLVRYQGADVYSPLLASPRLSLSSPVLLLSLSSPLLSLSILSSHLIGTRQRPGVGGAFSPDVIAQQPRGLVGDLLWACTGWVSAFAIANGNSIRAESSALSTGWVSAIAIEIGYSTRAEGSA